MDDVGFLSDNDGGVNLVRTLQNVYAVVRREIQEGLGKVRCLGRGLLWWWK